MGSSLSSNPVMQDRMLNSGVHSDTLEQLKVPPKEMIRVLGLAPSWYVKQPSKGRCDGCTSCPDKETYKVGTTIDASADMFNAVEQSSAVIRCCCVNSRYWTTDLFYGAQPGGALVLKLQHPCRLPCLPMKCCCFQQVSITDVQNEVSLGSVSETCWLCVPNYTVRNAKGDDVFDIHPPTCCCGCCVNFCASNSSTICCRVPFEVYLPGTDRPVGNISKLWKNFLAEIASDDDTYRFIGPEVKPIVDPGRLNLGNIDKKIGMVGTKYAADAKGMFGMTNVNNVRYNMAKIPQQAWEQNAQLLASTILINQIHFET